MRPAVAALLLLAACSRAPAPPAAAVPDTAGYGAQLREAEAAFQASTAARGLDGWMAWYAPDAVRLVMGGKVSQGTAAVRAHDAELFADPAARLSWQLTDAGAFADGRHGFTTGTAAMVRGADTLYKGTYVTLWRREADGGWKVVLDTGS
jgi:ketosteroid isomerase-like protein